MNVLNVHARANVEQNALALQRLKGMLDSWNLMDNMRSGILSIFYDSGVGDNWQSQWGNSTKYFVLDSRDLDSPASTLPQIGLNSAGDFPSRFEDVVYKDRGNCRIHLREAQEHEYKIWKDKGYYNNQPSLYYYVPNFVESSVIDGVVDSGVGSNAIYGRIFFDGEFRRGDLLELYFQSTYKELDIRATGQVGLPVGYYDAIMSNLALELAPFFGLQINDVSFIIRQKAHRGMMLIQARNLVGEEHRMDDVVSMSGGSNPHGNRHYGRERL